MHTYTDCFHAKDEIDLVFLSEFTALTCKYDTFLHTVMKRACLHAFVLFFFVGDALYACSDAFTLKIFDVREI